MKAILPGATLGMLGGGQLGRMFVSAAHSIGYRVIVLDPDHNSPAGKIASEHLQAAYDDGPSLDYLAQHCAVITTEFENIPADTLDYLAKSVPVHPSASALRVAQNRLSEKAFFTGQGLNIAPYLTISSIADIAAAKDFSFPAILKTATLGYDGKGQVVCASFDDLPAAYAEISAADCVLERKIDLALEVSVVLCRSVSGIVDCFPIAQNQHVDGILDVSIVPAALSPALAEQVIDAAQRIAQGLEYCGVLAVEFFISQAGEVLVNEMAPRPHNSGHYTLDACPTSQFEQQLRMICGLAAGASRLHGPVAMWNILGDIWPQTGEPDWGSVLSEPNAKLHLYGKLAARPGRKMGHINCLGTTGAETLALLGKIKNRLREP